MQQADSFSSVKGWEIEMLQCNHRGCVQPQCHKITTITGHQQIFGLNACVSTLWPALGLDSSVCRWDRKWNTFILWKCRHVCCLHHNASADLQKVTMRKCGKIKMFLATRFCILLEDVLIWFDFLISKFDTFFGHCSCLDSSCNTIREASDRSQIHSVYHRGKKKKNPVFKFVIQG